MSELVLNDKSNDVQKVFELYVKGLSHLEISRVLKVKPRDITKIYDSYEFKSTIDDWKKRELEYGDVYLQSEYIKYRHLSELATERLKELMESTHSHVALAACKMVLNRADELRRDQSDSRIRELESFVMTMALERQDEQSQLAPEPARKIEMEQPIYQ